MLRWPSIRRLISGRPIMVIKDGIPLEQEMKKIRFSNDDLLEELRKNGVFNIDTVGCAIVETDGTLSVYLKASEQPLTPKTAKIEVKDNGIAVTVISDGAISDFGLSFCGKDIKWLNKIIEKENVKIEDTFLMTCDKAGNYSVFKKDGK